jgi:hypothetical protein
MGSRITMGPGWIGTTDLAVPAPRLRSNLTNQGRMSPARAVVAVTADNVRMLQAPELGTQIDPPDSLPRPGRRQLRRRDPRPSRHPA